MVIEMVWDGGLFPPTAPENVRLAGVATMSGADPPPPPVTVNGAEVTLVSPVDANVSVRSPALPVTARFVNYATPALALIIVVPPSVPPPDATVAVTALAALETTLFARSRTSTTGWVASGAPLAAPTGCVRIPRRAGNPAVSTIALEVAGVSPVAEKRSV